MTFDIIDAFLDRERVDADALEAALASKEGRDYLIDVVALREVAADHPPAPWWTPATPTRGWFQPLTIAATMAAALLGGYAIGRRAPSAAQLDSVPVVRSERATAPAPTSVIRLEPGVDWDEQVTRN
jgi:hypothetical protein